MTYELKPWPKPKRRKLRQGSHTLKRGKSLKRTKMRCNGPRTQKSGGHLFPKGVDEARRDFIRAQACVVTGRVTGEWIKRESWMPLTLPKWWKCFVVAAHCKGRGASGVDKSNMVPLDSRMHDWQGQIGWAAFERRLKLESRFEMAAEFERRYLLEAA